MTQPRRRSTLKIVLIILAVVIVVCCGGGAAGFYFLLTGATKAPKAATSAFLDELEAGNYAAAYNRLCADTKSEFEQPTFEEKIKARQPKSHDLDWGGSYDNTNGRETAAITGDVTFTDGSSNNESFQLRKEGGDWKVCGNPLTLR
ncbi:DUF4878 domain-containing protein [Dactylosporangium roseum]|uniref:DUF4878 domain-containing protein n=1 Tax=Dactylosporangium roseum TaxID=47989 RepID=A0ABY5ZAJ4_9ACTN|nr:DUF4878 domain-containing protein [Dactylosporangium roseum]UWZ37713.1 DUF4878 domain-containing protein [Dactylosporangium roseum]